MSERSAVVLAGGRSRRFGADKTLAPFAGGEPLVARVVRTLRELGFAQVLIAAKDVSRYQSFAETVLDAADAQTPLSGLVAGLRAARHDLVFACAADMPFVADRALVEALAGAVQDVAMPRHAGVLQPLAAMWRSSACLPAAEEQLKAPRPPGPRVLTSLLRTAYVDWPDERPFLDADTPEALAALEAQR
jgi:molybdopterin-guanine dinucleotide biosynthesis protein A